MASAKECSRLREYRCFTEKFTLIGLLCKDDGQAGLVAQRISMYIYVFNIIKLCNRPLSLDKKGQSLE